MSLTSARRECIEGRPALLKRIRISVESFVRPSRRSVGLLYCTGKRLTRYRIHGKTPRFLSLAKARLGPWLTC